MDGPIPTAGHLAVDGVRRAPGQYHHPGLAAHRVVDVAAEVLGPDVDMHNHQLRAARDEKVAMRRRHRHVLVQTWHQSWDRLAVRRERYKRFLDRRGVGAGIKENVLDATRDQELKDRFGPRARGRPQPHLWRDLRPSGWCSSGQLGRCDSHSRSRSVYARPGNRSDQLRPDYDIRMTLGVTPPALG